VNLRLEELYRRYLSLHDEIVGYYDSGLGNSKPERSAEAEQEPFAICQATTDAEVFHAGDHDRPFALQSISKMFVYGLAVETCGRERVLVRVGIELSGDAFNSIVFDERNNRPYNPMVNAGALATPALVEDGVTDGPALHRILDTVRRYAGNNSLEVDEDIFEAEM
jgi:glutaminase